jgi:membrane protease subunit HflK
MAWNEPGKPGQDPWGDQKKPQTPNQRSSDPTEQLRKQLDNFLGKIGGNGNNGNTPEGGQESQGMGVGVGALVALAGIIWLGSGIYIIEPAERGVVTVFGAYSSETTSGPHWNWPAPIGGVIKVNVDEIRNAEIGYRSVKTGSTDVGGESLMLTQDENIVDVKLAIQYNINSASNYVFNQVEPDLALKEVTESALREVVGKSKMDFVLTEGRSQVVAKVRELAQAALDDYKLGIQVTSVNLQDAQPPEQVQSAFADVVKAREDRQRLINEAEAYSNDIIPKARGQSARLVEEATAYRDQVTSRAEGEANRFASVLTQYKLSPDVTRQRMYLETVEQVLGSSSKIMVSNKSAGQMMYLPLDKWMQEEGVARKPVSGAAALPEATMTATPSQAPSLRENLRSREAR